MGFFQKFEGKMEDTVEGMASSLGSSSLSPVQITKKAEKQMRREKIVGAGVQYAPTLYTVLVSPEDDARLFGYYPTLAGEVETYLMAKASEIGLVMDGQPLVRFLSDPELKRGKFDVVAEMVAAPIIAQLREEEMQRYGIAVPEPRGAMRQRGGQPVRSAARPAQPQPMRQQPVFVQPQPAPMPAATPAPARASYQAPAPARHYDEPAYGDAGYGRDADYGRGRDAGYGHAHAHDYYDDDLYDDDFYEDHLDEAPKTTVMGAVEQPKFSNNYSMDIDVYLYDAARDRAYELTGQPQRIGRESANDIVVPDINVSRVHAEIRRDTSGSWVISDLGSTNGVFVNNRQVKTAPLRDADIILLGTTELEFQLLS